MFELSITTRGMYIRTGEHKMGQGKQKLLGMLFVIIK